MEKEKKKVSSIRGRSRKKKWDNKFIISLFVFISLIFVIVFYIISTKTHTTNVKNMRIASSNLSGSSIKYKKLNDGYVRITNDGIVFFDKNGIIKWNVSYNISKFLIDAKNDYIAISSAGGKKAYVFNDKGKTLEYEVKSNESIEKIAVSSKGELALLISDETNEYLKKFVDGKLQDITDSINMERQIATDISISDDGKYISMSYLYKDKNYDDRLLSKVSLYYFDETYALINGVRYIMSLDGDSGIDKVDMLMKIKFVGSDSLYLITDNKLYHTYIENNYLKINKKYVLNNNVRSIYSTSDYIGLVLDNMDYDISSKKNNLEVYDKNGKRVVNKKVDQAYYDDFYITKDNIVFKNNNEINIYPIFGRQIFKKKMEEEVIYVEKIRSFPLPEYNMATNNMFRTVLIY